MTPDLFEKYKKPVPTARSERDEQIQRFYGKQCIKIRDRKTRKLRLADKAEIALLLRNCPTEDLHPFFKQCEGARSFSRWFWWAIKRR